MDYQIIENQKNRTNTFFRILCFICIHLQIKYLLLYFSSGGNKVDGLLSARSVFVCVWCVCVCASVCVSVCSVCPYQAVVLSRVFFFFWIVFAHIFLKGVCSTSLLRKRGRVSARLSRQYHILSTCLNGIERMANEI